MESRGENGSMSKDQAESSCVKQSKLDALLINSNAQVKTISDKTEKQTGTKVDFVEPQRKKHESTSLPQINNSLGSGITKTASKRGVLNSTRIPRDSVGDASVIPDVMKWAYTWEIMNTSLEAWNTESSDRGGVNPEKLSRSQRKSKMTRVVA